MISIDDHPPPDPSSSHHHHQQQNHISHDLKLSDIDLKFLDADLDDTNDNHLPNFSIRDYVFGLRSKDVACNWPFSPTSLQLCLKHGVKNLLPPFQPLDLLRDNSSVSRCNLEDPLHDEETIISFHEKPRNDDQFISKGEQPSGFVTVSTNSSCSKRHNNQEHLIRTKSKEKPPASSHHTENIKKSRLVMKFNPGVEPVEEISMGSKICPVCKIFSSSSNTTLNAHIDQCLTGEGTMKWTDNPKLLTVQSKNSIKETEQAGLQIRVFLLKNFNFKRKKKKQKKKKKKKEEEEEEEEEEKQEQSPRTTTINHEVVDNEGDVYIDTDGTKVRILSVPKSGSLENNHGNRKLLKGVKGSKLVIGTKKKFKSNLHKQKHHKKYLKLIPNARKVCSSKPQARNDEEEDAAIAENCRKDEPPRKPVNDPVDDLAIVRPPWACSKRTNLVKKLTGKRKHRKNLRIESDKSSSRCDLGYPPLSSDDVALLQSRKKTRTSSPLMAEFRKESTRMHEDNEGSPDSSSPSHNSDRADKRSKGRKFLRKNLSFPVAKLNLKRKSSSFNGTFQDSSKENSLSRNEEHVAAVRNNEETRSRSVTSKTSNEESSVGVETADVDAFHDIQSVRNETLLSNLEQVCVVPPPNFTGLSNSFDPDFSKCVEMYQEQLLCSTNRAPDVEKHDFFFHEDEPIPIPGPPGSFLPPSPGGDVVSEEQVQANSSSTTTTRVPSSDQNHHHDTMDRDSMSNSPVSTVSNPSLARSDSRSTSVAPDDTKYFPTSFKNDHHQPCCCSRKDGAFSYNQELSIVRRQTMESNKSSSAPGVNFNFRSDTFPLSNYSTSQAPETAIFPLPTMKKLPIYGDNDSVASPSKPVLRLMGKNLTVVKTDEDVLPSPSSQPFRPPQGSQQHHPQPPVIFTQFQNGSESQRFNVYPHPQMNMRSTTHGGFMASVDRYGYGGHYLGHTAVPHARSHSHHGHNSKEIIIIDDLPENELDDSMRNDILRRNHGQMNPLYSMYQAQSSGHLYSSGGGGSMVFHGGSFNGDLGKWNVGSSSSPSRSTSRMRSSTSYYPPSYP
ncbi:unnamed protein product [Lactuca virosa]|uniref:UBZ4-type domain-containing protein n=1 Tax=Lactuca virosa TaxID=75947 RepID=A0AAU9PN56_9ASTR|nr:unnamed protein product [Lactuca virosa]